MIRLSARLVPLLVGHLAAYLQLATDEFAESQQTVVRRLLAVALALVSGIVTTLLACLWLIALTWDTRWRVATIVLLLVAFGLATAICGVAAGRRWPAGRRPFERLRTEWECDQDLLRALLASPDPVPSDAITQAMAGLNERRTAEQ